MARDFAGSGGAGIVATAIASQDSFTSFTLSFWYQRTSGGGEFGYGRPFTKDPYWQVLNDNGNGGFGMLFEVDFSTTNGLWSVAYPSNGAWVNETITYNGTSTTNDPIWYRNGSSIAITERATPSGSLATDTSEFYVGRSQDGTEWDGPVCETAYWNRILTPGEVAALGKGYSARFFSSGLKFYMPVIGRADPEPDLAGGITGTVTGTTNFAHPRMIYPRSGFIVPTPSVVASTTRRYSLTTLGVG